MRVRSIRGATLFFLLIVGLLVVGIAGPAQGGADEEVRRAVERAVGASIASAVSESLSRSIVSEGLLVMPKTTLFTSPFYNRTEGDVDFGSFEADTYGGLVGALYKVHDIFLIHGSVAGAAFSADVTLLQPSTPGGNRRSSSDGRFINFLLGGDLVYLNTQHVKAWLTVEGSFSNFDTDVTNNIWSWAALPSTTVSIRTGNILFEPFVGFSFSNTFGDIDVDTRAGAEDVDTSTTTAFRVGGSLKYRGEKFRPQLNFVYSKTIDPNPDDGFISVGPEILYAVTPSVLIGAAYAYGTPLDSGINVNSHTATLELRWIF